MKQIINFIDADVDGCGTDVETMIQIEGDQALTNGAIKRIKDAIERYKKENYGNICNRYYGIFSITIRIGGNSGTCKQHSTGRTS